MKTLPPPTNPAPNPAVVKSKSLFKSACTEITLKRECVCRTGARRFVAGRVINYTVKREVPRFILFKSNNFFAFISRRCPLFYDNPAISRSVPAAREQGEWKVYFSLATCFLFTWQVIAGNTNTYVAEKRELDPVLIARKVRFFPYSHHRRTVCMRVELYGCQW